MVLTEASASRFQEQSMAEDKSAGQRFCSECGHWVKPDTNRSASMLAGTVVTIECCPGCRALLEAKAS
jgi:hypothetical protein